MNFKIRNGGVLTGSPCTNITKLLDFTLKLFFSEDRQAGNFKEAYFNVPGPECDIFPKICVD